MQRQNFQSLLVLLRFSDCHYLQINVNKFGFEKQKKSILEQFEVKWTSGQQNKSIWIALLQWQHISKIPPCANYSTGFDCITNIKN